MSALNTDLTGRVALVTGSSRGLGAATVEHLAALGAEPIVTFRNAADDAAHVADQARARGVRCHVRRLDMSDAESIAELFAWITDEGPARLDVLVANAAATSFKGLLDQKRHNIERTFAISVSGFLDAVQRAVPLMQATGRGRIVAISGGDARGYGPTHGLLAAAKAAMEMLVRYLHVELAGSGVTAIGVSPDAFRSAGPAIMLGEFYERLMRFLDAAHPLGRIAEADDMAQVVAFCCTDAATWLCGDTLVADGGDIFSAVGRLVEAASMLPAEQLEALSRALVESRAARGQDSGGTQ